MDGAKERDRIDENNRKTRDILLGEKIAEDGDLPFSSSLATALQCLREYSGVIKFWREPNPLTFVWEILVPRRGTGAISG